jgi:hypothetical protein
MTALAQSTDLAAARRGREPVFGVLLFFPKIQSNVHKINITVVRDVYHIAFGSNTPECLAM